MNEKSLRQYPLFSDLTDAEIAEVQKYMVTRKFRKNVLIIFEDDVGNSLFIIKTGRVKISHLSKDGAEAILAILGEGDFFGELSVIDGLGRSASVTSIDEVELIMLKRPDFIYIIQRIPKIALTLLKELAARIRKSDTHIRSLSLFDARGRVATTLIRLAEDIGTMSDGRMTIQEMPLQRDIAAIAGTSRETISRTIKRFEEEGLCVVEQNALIFTNFNEFKRTFS